MLTSEGCAARRQRLWNTEAARGCSALVVGHPAHLVYLANYLPSPFEFRTNESAALLVLEPSGASLVADGLLDPYTSEAHVEAVDRFTWYDGQQPTEPRPERLVEATLERLARVGGNKFGIELASVPAGVVEGLRAARPGVEIVDLSGIIRPLRRAKDADEIETLRRVMRAGEAGHAAALAEIKSGMTELDAYLVVQNAAIRSLGERAIVYGDFASGPRTATDKGGPPTSRVIEPGDLLLLDFSVDSGGYRSDFTNTFVVGGEPTPEQIRLFSVCSSALGVAEALLKPGTVCKDIDAAVRAHFDSFGYLHAFPHHTGHGIGLGHPEPPYFVPNSDEVLVVGDVVAIEPGLYVEGIGGIRVERDYLITESGFETLSNHRIALQP